VGLATRGDCGGENGGGECAVRGELLKAARGGIVAADGGWWLGVRLLRDASDAAERAEVAERGIGNGGESDSEGCNGTAILSWPLSPPPCAAGVACACAWASTSEAACPLATGSDALYGDGGARVAGVLVGVRALATFGEEDTLRSNGEPAAVAVTIAGWAAEASGVASSGGDGGDGGSTNGVGGPRAAPTPRGPGRRPSGKNRPPSADDAAFTSGAAGDIAAKEAHRWGHFVGLGADACNAVAVRGFAAWEEDAFSNWGLANEAASPVKLHLAGRKSAGAWALPAARVPGEYDALRAIGCRSCPLTDTQAAVPATGAVVSSAAWVAACCGCLWLGDAADACRDSGSGAGARGSSTVAVAAAVDVANRVALLREPGIDAGGSIDSIAAEAAGTACSLLTALPSPPAGVTLR